MNDTMKDHRVILFVDDDTGLMHDYYNWMSDLSHAYYKIYRSCMHRLFDMRAYRLKDLDSTLDKINNVYDASLNLVITDFDLIPGTGNDVARKVRAKFPNVPIIGNTGGSPDNFDKSLVTSAVDKIRDKDTLYDIIDKHTRIRLDTGDWDFFKDAKKGVSWD